MALGLHRDVPAEEDTGLPWMDPVGGIHREDNHRPCEEEDTRDRVDNQDTEDIQPCVEAYHKVLPRNHVGEADIPVGELPHPPEEIHRDTREVVVEEDNRTEAAVLPAYREACVHLDVLLLVVVVADDVVDEKDGVVAEESRGEEVDGLLPVV